MTAITYVLVTVSIVAGLAAWAHLIWQKLQWNALRLRHQESLEKALQEVAGLMPPPGERRVGEPPQIVEELLSVARRAIDEVPLALYTRDEQVNRRVGQLLSMARELRDALESATVQPKEKPGGLEAG